MSNDCLLRLENEDERLLPGLPDDIILDQIVPSLPWTAFHILALVSLSWRRAIRSRRVYDARVRSHSTETIIVLDSRIDDATALYSMRDNSWLQLPKLPRPATEVLFQHIPLDGKIYILGELSGELNVLDVAGHGEWKPCATMPEIRLRFVCGVVDGKICVVGGDYLSGKSARASLVYDPKENAWSSIIPRNYKRGITGGVTSAGELFVHCRRTYTEVYHPGRYEWILVKHFEARDHEEQVLVTAHGKPLLMTPRSHEMGIFAHDRK